MYRSLRFAGRGDLTDDPELRFTQSGVPVANFRVAVTPRVPDGQGGFQDGETSFLRVTAWRSLAENVADSLGKGARVVVLGRLRTSSWETPEARSARPSRSRPMRSLRPCAS